MRLQTQIWRHRLPVMAFARKRPLGGSDFQAKSLDWWDFDALFVIPRVRCHVKWTNYILVVFVSLGGSFLQLSLGSMSVMADESHAQGQFLFRGLPLEDAAHSPKVDALLAAEGRYGTLTACLERGKPEPKLAWSTFKGIEDVEVCVFHVADALRDRGRIVEWLTSEGFTNVVEPPHPANVMLDYGQDHEGWMISASWAKSKRPFPFGMIDLWRIRLHCCDPTDL